jgi:hypothetical protein
MARYENLPIFKKAMAIELRDLCEEMKLLVMAGKEIKVS